MLHVHHSNRLERLADRLCEVIAAPLGPALAPETIVVPNPGMARWLSLAVAQRLGVAANLDCLFPAAFVWRVLRAQDDALPSVPPAEQGPLLFALLAAFAAADRPAEVARYLAGDDGLKAWQLARRLADAYQRYQVFRPDWLADWEQGGGSGWDARLWQRVAAGRPHQGRLLIDLARRVQAGRLVTAGLPARVSVFGLSALAPAYLQVLQALSTDRDVHVQFLDPCAAYWHELQTPRAVARRRRRWAQQAMGFDPTDAANASHPLLAAWGQAGRAFAAQLLDCAAVETEHYDDPGNGSLLRRLQRDLLLLEPPRLADTPADDRSIEIHVCHSPLREVQVVHDRLLGLFKAQPDLTPRDCVVMAPDIDAYAPHIAAVFGSAPAGRRIPYAIADRAPRAEQALAAAFLELLDLPHSRLPASQVLSLLELPALCRAFGIGDDAVPRLRALVQASGARFAFDADARAGLGLPATDEHTWRAGLDRLLLGHATSESVGDLLPLPLASTELAEATGGLAELLRRLHALQHDLAGPHVPAEWTRRLLATLTLFEPGDEDEADTLALLRGAVLRFDAEAQAGGGAAPLARAVVKACLADALDEPGPARRFITGAVTCCALAPMRAVPFRVVCVLGLNDGEFPRRARPAEFDRLAGDYRPGDRVPRDDDRYLMLEALLAARDTLHLSYVGRRQTDNAPLPPSALITELAGVLRQMRAGGARVVEHPLQAFSARYGQAADLVTYAGEWFERAPPAPVFAGAPLAPDTRGERDDWTLDELLTFVRSPARWFLQGRLGIHLRKLDEAPADDEPFYLAGLDGYAVGQELVAARVTGSTPDDAYRQLRGAGALPAAAAGRHVFDRAWADAAELATRAAPLLAQPKPDRLLELDIAGTALAGRLSGLTAAGLVDCQYSKKANGQRLLSLWVRHLALNAAGEPVESHLLTREQTVRLAPVANAAATLADLLTLARQGLREPLPLPPKSAWAFAAADDPGKGMLAALREWNGDDHNHIPGERDDADVQLAFRGREPLAEPAFAALAMRVFGPLLAAWVDA